MDPDRDLDACFEIAMQLVDEAGQVKNYKSLYTYIRKNY